MKRLFACLTLAALAAFLLASCNTVAGVGKDIERAGQKIKDVSGK